MGMCHSSYAYPHVATVNFGDYVIDYAVRHLLERFLPAPMVECELSRAEAPTGVACLIIPGITHLTARPGHYLQGIDRLPYPTYCLAGSIWSELPHPGYLVRTRVISFRRNVEPDLTIVRKLAQPVGVRDPYTLEVLRRNGIECVYTGCPTLHLPASDVADDGYVLFSMARRMVRRQTRIAHRLARKYPIVGICHEKADMARYRAAGWSLPLVTYDGNVELYLSYFQRARTIVSGRLHGALPALAYGKPLFAFGTRDTRMTALDDLGVTVHPMGALEDSVERATPACNRTVIDYCRRNWETLLGALRALLADAV